MSSGNAPAFAATDATIEILDVGLDKCPDVLDVEMKVKNIGDAILPGGTPIAFYNDDPTMSMGTLLGATALPSSVAIDDSLTFTYGLNISPLLTPIDIYVVVNDTGFMTADLPYDLTNDFPVTGTAECDFTNNLHQSLNVECLEICGDGNDNDGDGLTDEPNITAPDTTGCSGDMLAQMTTDLPGGTWSIVTSIGSAIDNNGIVTLGTNNSSTPATDLVIYTLPPCNDTIEITTVDDVPPILTCPGNSTAPADLNCEALLDDHLDDITLSDNCTPAGSFTLNQSPVQGTVLSLGATTVTITAADLAGNQTTCDFIITITDFTDPTITCPADLPEEVDAGCDFTITDYTGGATVADNCSVVGNITITQFPPAGTIITGDGFMQNVLLTAEDEVGNTQSCGFIITLADNMPPSIACPADFDLNADANCEAVIGNYESLATISDNCAAPMDMAISQSPPAGTVLSGNGNSLEITITADDGNGNTGQCSFAIFLIDDIAPSITCPMDITIAADANCEITLDDYTDDATVDDNCTAMASISVTQMPAAGTTLTGPNATQVVTLTANDGMNTAQCTFTVTIADQTNPTIICPANENVTVDAACEIMVANYRTSATLDDNCTTAGSITVTQSPIAGTTLSGNGTIQLITLTADDGNGNTANCNFTITLQDQSDPNIACPMDQLLSVNASCEVALPDYTGSATLSDYCTVAGSVLVSQMPAPGLVLMGDGTMQTVTLTADDGNGNTAQCSFNVELEDNMNPSITCPADKLVDLDVFCDFILADYTSETSVMSSCDASGMTFNVTQSPAAGMVISGHGLTQVVTLTADDMMGHSSSCTFNVTTQDVTDPMIACPANSTIPVNDDCEITILDYTSSATVSDNCTDVVSIVVSQMPTSGAVYSGHGTTVIVMLTADDGNGNTAQCDFSILLNDITQPSIACPPDVALTVDGSCEATILDYTSSAFVMDNCTAPVSIVVSQTPPSGTVLTGHNQTQIITLTADDGNGNMAACNFTITTNDDMPPGITCPNDQTLPVDINCEITVPDYTSSAVFNDNCTQPGAILVTQTPAAGTTLSGHATTQVITLTADDGNGNAMDCTLNLSLTDQIDPSLACPSDLTVEVDASCEILLADYTSSATVSDNCTATNSIAISQIPAAGTPLSGEGTLQTVTLTANDGNGNMVTCNFDVTLNDVADPSINCPANLTEIVDNNCEFELPDYTGSATVNDNCMPTMGISISQTPPATTIIMGGGPMQVVTLTADDGNGNMASCDFTLTLNDVTDPIVVCPDNQSVTVNAFCEISLGDYTGSAAATDNCTASSSISISQTPAVGTVLSGHNTMQVVTLTADDGNGNIASCDFTVTLLDEQAPSVICPPNQTLAVDGDCEVVLPDFSGVASYSDNCTLAGSILISQMPAVGTVFTGHNITQNVTLTADDGNGNTASCTFSFTLDDDTSPVPVCPMNQTLNPDANCQVAIPDYEGMTTVTDNCTANGAIVLTQIPAAGTVLSGNGTIQIITIFADDGNGNTDQCSFEITLSDDTPPGITCPTSPQTLDVDDSCTVPLPDYTGSTTVTDNCNAPVFFIISQTPAPGTMVGTPGTSINVEITADDGNGNTSTCNFDVELVDNNDPSLTCPSNQTLYPDADCEAVIPDYTGLVAVTNECMMGTGITVTQSPIAGTMLSGHGTSQLITITADDGSGNMETCDFTVTLNDTLPPTIACPANLTEDLDGNCLLILADYTTSSTLDDNCTPSGNITVTQAPLAGSILSGDGTIQNIILTADDGNGNTAECGFRVTLNDGTAPIILCPTNQDVIVNGGCEATLNDYTSSATVSDNCSSTTNITVSQMPAVGTVVSGHNTVQTITLTAEDENGNTENCTFDLTLLDETLPNILCPADVTVDVDANCEYAITDFTSSATVSDNCTPSGNITVSQSPAVGTVLANHNFTQTIALTADDGNGNTAQCTFDITLADNTDPALACPPDVILDVDVNCEIVLPDYTSAAVFSDNCANAGAITVTQSPLAGTTYSGHNAMETITLTADDGNGNSAQCTLVISLNDATDPSIGCPADQSILLDENCEATLPDYTSFAILNDNCTPALSIAVSQSPIAGTTFSGSDAMATITLTADDGNGNTASCDFTVTFDDVTDPSITCPADFTADVNTSCEYTLLEYANLLTANNECGNETSFAFTQMPAAATILSGHNTMQLVTIEATDETGNTATCDFLLTLNDNIPPSITCPADATVSAAGCDQSLGDYMVGLFYNDNCSLVPDIILTQSPAAGTVFTSGIFTITLTAEDEAGNVGSCDFELTLDLTPPTVPIITGN